MNTTIQLEGKQFTQWNFKDLSTYELLQDQVKHFRKLAEFKDGDRLSNMELDYLIKNEYNFTLIVVNESPLYGYEQNEMLVKLVLGYCSSKPLTMYIDKDYMIELID